MNIPKHLEYAHSRISDVPDFPKPGILFKDITPVLQDPKAFNDAVDDLATHLNGANIVAGIESRGFIFAAAIAASVPTSNGVLAGRGRWWVRPAAATAGR